jgi:hypothetical protein
LALILLTENYTFETRPTICYESFHSAYDSAFVAHYQELIDRNNPSARKTIIVHINSLDELLWKLEYPQPIEEMVMVKEDRLVVPLTQEKAIETVDLRRQVKKRVSFDFTGNSSKLQLLYFPER